MSPRVQQIGPVLSQDVLVAFCADSSAIQLAECPLTLAGCRPFCVSMMLIILPMVQEVCLLTLMWLSARFSAQISHQKKLMIKSQKTLVTYILTVQVVSLYFSSILCNPSRHLLIRVWYFYFHTFVFFLSMSIHPSIQPSIFWFIAAYICSCSLESEMRWDGTYIV